VEPKAEAPPPDSKSEPAKPDAKVLSPAPASVPAPAPVTDATKGDASKADATKGTAPAKSPDVAKSDAKADPAKVASTIPPATLVFAVTPWGEIFVNGSARGVVAPMKSMKLDPGEYKM